MKPQEHSKIFIAADLGCLRAFRLNPPKTEDVPHQGPAAVEEIHFQKEEHDSDRPGRFPQGRRSDEAVSMSPGEHHEAENESIKRRLQFLAKTINTILIKEGPNPWILAAPPAINRRLLELIEPERKSFLLENLQSDLTHATLRDIEGRFLHPAQS